MKTTLNVLSAIGIPVPDEILIELSDRIRTKEERNKNRKINRMSEEELIHYHSRQKTTLRIVLDDGRLIQGRTNDVTFTMALRELGQERIKHVTYNIGRKPLFIFDDTSNKMRFKHYLIVEPGLLVYGKTTAVQKKQILDIFDQKYQLNWDISIQ